MEIIEKKKWKKLCTPPTNLNYEIVREFYANDIPVEDQPYSFITMVIRTRISFSRDAINTYLGNPLTLEDGMLCEYGKRLARGGWNIELVKDALVLPRKSYEVNAAGAPKNFLRKNLTMIAQVLMTLVLYNIRPRSHTSSILLDITYLLYYILDDIQVDVGRIISNEIKMITESAHRLGSKTSSTLAFPGMIRGCAKEIVSQYHSWSMRPLMVLLTTITLRGIVSQRQLDILELHHLMLNNRLMMRELHAFTLGIYLKKSREISCLCIIPCISYNCILGSHILIICFQLERNSNNMLIGLRVGDFIRRGRLMKRKRKGKHVTRVKKVKRGGYE